MIAQQLIKNKEVVIIGVTLIIVFLFLFLRKKGGGLLQPVRLPNEGTKIPNGWGQSEASEIVVRGYNAIHDWTWMPDYEGRYSFINELSTLSDDQLAVVYNTYMAKYPKHKTSLTYDISDIYMWNYESQKDALVKRMRKLNFQ